MWVRVGTNFAQVIADLRLALDNEHEKHFHGYRPRDPTAVPSRIYQALLECGEKLHWPAIVRVANITTDERQRAAHALMDLIHCKHVAREGTRRKYKYWAIRRAD